MYEAKSVTPLGIVVAGAFGVFIAIAVILMIVFGALLFARHKDNGRSLALGVEGFSINFWLGKLTEGTRTGSTGTTNSPLKVRGGSMTVRSSSAWKDVVGNRTKFCTNIADISHLELIDVKAVVSASNVNVPLALDNLNLVKNPAWTLEFHGRSRNVPPASDGQADSKNGIVLIPQAHTCDDSQDTSSNSVLLQLIQANGNAAFYPNDTQGGVSEGNTEAERFQDLTPASGSAPACSTDEDLCERISTITLTIDPSGTKTVYSYKCPNGECMVGVGR